jgi:hypothetical protein
MEQTPEINQRRNHHAQPTVCENQYSRKAVTRSCQIPVTVANWTQNGLCQRDNLALWAQLGAFPIRQKK